MSAHEDFTRKAETRPASNRSFGIVFTLVLAAVGLWPVRAGQSFRPWALASSAVLLAALLLRPSLLTPFNWLWTEFGFVLNKVTSPVVTGLLFYLVFTPVGFLLRLGGKDPLRLRFDPDAKSYWIPRRPPGPAPSTMSNPF